MGRGVDGGEESLGWGGGGGFRGGLVVKAHRLCVSLNSRLESIKKKRRRGGTSHAGAVGKCRRRVSCQRIGLQRESRFPGAILPGFVSGKLIDSGLVGRKV